MTCLKRRCYSNWLHNFLLLRQMILHTARQTPRRGVVLCVLSGTSVFISVGSNFCCRLIRDTPVSVALFERRERNVCRVPVWRLTGQGGERGGAVRGEILVLWWAPLPIGLPVWGGEGGRRRGGGAGVFLYLWKLSLQDASHGLTDDRQTFWKGTKYMLLWITSTLQ